MSELTTNKIITIIIAVFVLVIVLIALSYAMGEYIIPYFRGLGPQEPEIDVTSPFYQNCLKNIVALVEQERYSYIKLKQTDGSFKKTEYYLQGGKVVRFEKTSSLVSYVPVLGPFIVDRLDWDTEVGIIDSEGKIKLEEEQAKKDLKEIDGATKVYNEICKIKVE